MTTNPASLTSSSSSFNQAIAPLLDPACNLPTEVVTERILPYLNVKSIVACSELCKEWNVLTQNDTLWHILFDRDYSSDNSKQITNFKEAYKRLYFNLTKGVFTTDVFQKYPSVVEKMAIADGRFFCAIDNEIKILDLKRGVCTAALGHATKVQAFTITDDKLFSSADRIIKVWDLKTGTCMHTFNGPSEFSALASTGGKLYAGDIGGRIMIFDLETKTCTLVSEAHDNGVWCLAIADAKLFSSGSDHAIKDWDLKTGNCIDTIEGNSLAVSVLAIAHTKLFAASRYVSRIEILDLETGKWTSKLEGHTGGVTSLVIAYNRLFSGSVDNTIKIWDLETEKCTATLGYWHMLNFQGVSNVIFSLAADRYKLISSSNDQTIKIFDFSADHDAVLEEIAELFENDAVLAAARFSRMPEAVKRQIYAKIDEVYHYKKIDVEEIFHPDCAYRETTLKGQLIRAYLGEQPSKVQPSLAHLGIITRKDFSDILKCRPEYLQKIGISSLDDLKCICSLSSVTKLTTVEVEEINENRESQINAKNRMVNLESSTEELLKIVDNKLKETSVEFLYGPDCPWTNFQKELSVFQAKLHDIDTQCDGEPTKIMHAYSPENYNNLVGKLNAFIEEFSTLDHNHQVAKLKAYVTQWGILTAWTNRKARGLYSITDLPVSEQELEKLLRMGE